VSDIFTEVDEEVRREQLVQLWKQYQNYIIAAVVLVIAAVAGWRGYDYWQGVKAGEAGAAYDAAAQLAAEGKHSEAEQAFAKIAAEGTPGYKALAQLRAASEIAGRDAKAGVQAYDRIAGELTGQPLFSELASVRAALLLVDTANYSEMTARLEPLAQPSGAFRHTARELLALSAWRSGDAVASRRWVDAIRQDPETPAGMRQRLEVLAALLPEPTKPELAKPESAKPESVPGAKSETKSESTKPSSQP
jgi:hypothetical protein